MKTLLSFVLATTIATSANAIEVAYGMGEHSFETNRQRLAACTIAENKALKDALMKFADQKFDVTSQTRCIDSKEHAYCDYIKEIDASVSGTIRGVVDRVKRYKDNTCYVEIKVEIEPAKVIRASVETTRFYQPGESIQIKIQVGQPLYLYIFNLHEKGVDILFPNQYTKDSLIDDRFVYPQEGITVEAMLSENDNVSNETLLFLFTKQRQDFKPAFVTKESLKTILESIPVTEKKLVQQHIVIKRSK